MKMSLVKKFHEAHFLDAYVEVVKHAADSHFVSRYHKIKRT